MKTLDEVIAELEDEGLFADALYYLKMYRSDMQMYAENQKHWEDELMQKIKDFGDAKERFVKRLKELDIGTLNDPLTWDELKSMEGKPVWVVVDGKGRWRIIRKVSSEHLILESGLPLHRCWINYPDGWQAYRKEHHDDVG